MAEVGAEVEENFTSSHRNIKILLAVKERLESLFAEFLGVLGSEFLIVDALGGEVPDVHRIVMKWYY